MKRLVVLVAAGLSVLAGAAFAEDFYLDDRSDAARLVRSLYNAVNRHEYARAFSYFSKPPAKTFEAYVKGYEGTGQVDVITGGVKSEGTAGSTYYTVPTAIRAKSAKGDTRYFAGCYSVKAVGASIQDPPFRPLQIDSAKLKPATVDDYASNTLPDCGGGEETQELDDEAVLAEAKQAFARDSGCDKAADTLGGANEPEAFKIIYKRSYASVEDPEEVFRLYAFVCAMGAYNEVNVFYGQDSVEGLRRLSFAAPHLTYVYADEEESTLKSMAVDGFQSDDSLINASYDPEKKTIGFFSKWRGIGDASSSGVYAFKEGEFILQDYEVDPTTDEEMNPYAVIRGGLVLAQPELVPQEP